MSCIQMSTKGAVPSPRGFHTATIVGKSLVIFGGTDSTSVFGDTYVLDLDTQIWAASKCNARQGLRPSPRHCHAAVRVGQVVVAVGGRGKGDSLLSDCWSYNVEYQRWTRFDSTSLLVQGQGFGISNHSLTQIGTKLVLIGGRGEKAISDEVWVSTTSLLPLPARCIIDYANIKIYERVGYGHFSKVNRGTYNGMEVAVKKLRTKIFRRERDKLLRAFKQEIALLSNLDHPNVIRMVGICTKPKCIIIELLALGCLRDYSANKFPHMDQQICINIAADYTHRRE
eukprot:TRINITY_DN7715_c0_g2_i1.p1 TRINITY_DN7715_c0_g2~~TRINITY_DN7715_c0_g2_i1.p1  ORF type:complete len:284 (-),score=26.84 TRINITY_DN7715_c0_g2_i1:50-901(-)